MENERKQLEEKTGEMHKRRETMPDGKRYIIYYTFGDKKTGEISASAEHEVEVNENV